MRKIRLTFPNKTEILATLWEKEEPELSESLWNFLEKEQGFICHNTLSTGYAFAAFPRPTRSPSTSSHLANPIGRNKIGYTSLFPGGLLWSGSKLYVPYGKCTEPSIAGAVTAKVIEECLESFIAACHEVWNYTFYFHKVAVLKVCREG
jgi:hypothetical protein